MTAVNSAFFVMALVNGVTTDVVPEVTSVRSQTQEIPFEGVSSSSTIEMLFELPMSRQTPVWLAPDVRLFLEEKGLSEDWRRIQVLLASSFDQITKIEAELRRDYEEPEIQSIHVRVWTSLDLDNAWAAYRSFTRARVEIESDSACEMFTFAVELP
jgi:hypothetical protein